ncbi:MAG: N-acyl homoserine lactonase family protein [Firmicutes bacterium]|nr:N-acyl homoserine lactonase family protein [Bacillota bacterium]
MKLAIIPVGHFDSDYSVLSPDAPVGQRVHIPVYTYLLDTNQGLILFDTGCSNECRIDPAGLLGAEMVPLLTPKLAPEDHIEGQLKRLNLTPADIDLVVNSHCHFDHAGGNEAFPTNHFGIQKTEYEAALEDREAYPDLAFKPADTARITLYEGDTDLAPGATLVYTPGHTLGHQSLLVELNDGPVLITSDAVYTRGHFSLDHIGASKSLELARASMTRLLDLARDGSRPFFSHDAEQVAQEGWKLAPYWYE